MLGSLHCLQLTLSALDTICANVCFLCLSAGSPPTWLRCPQLPRLFALDLLESVLLHRAAAFHGSEVLSNLLNDKVSSRGLAIVEQ